MSALDAARSAIDRCESELRRALVEAGTDKEALHAIGSALAGLHDYGHEVHALIADRERDERIEALEAEAASEESLHWLRQTEAHGDKVA